MHRILCLCLMSIVSPTIFAAMNEPDPMSHAAAGVYDDTFPVVDEEFDQACETLFGQPRENPEESYVDEALRSSEDPLVRLAWAGTKIMYEHFMEKYRPSLDSYLYIKIPTPEEGIKEMCMCPLDLRSAMDRENREKYPNTPSPAEMAIIELEELENWRVVGGLLIMRAAAGGYLPEGTLVAPAGWIMDQGNFYPDDVPVIPPAAAGGAGSAAASANVSIGRPIDPEYSPLLSRLTKEVPLTPGFLADFAAMHRLHARIVRENYWYCRILTTIHTREQIKELHKALEDILALENADVAECNRKMAELEKLLPKLKVYEGELKKVESELEALKTAAPSETVESALRLHATALELAATQEGERLLANKERIAALLAPVLAARAAAGSVAPTTAGAPSAGAGSAAP